MKKLASWIGVTLRIIVLILSVLIGLGVMFREARLRKFTMEFDDSQTTSSRTRKIKYPNTRN